MCIQVYNLITHEEVESPSELRRMLGVTKLIPAYNSDVIDDNCCLCQVNVKATIFAAGWNYSEANGDFMEVEVTPPGEELPGILRKMGEGE